MATSAGATLLDVGGFSVSYGKVEAVRNISLKVERGTIVSVIGPNGAGKTTLLAALMGLLPAKGGLAYLGASARTLTVEQRVARGLILVPERRELFAAMSVADNLELGGFQRAMTGERSWRSTQDEIYERFPRLKERREQLAGTLSGGERQMVAMGRALMGKPKLLMLDEPSLGLAPKLVEKVYELLASIRARGVAMLVVEQNAARAFALADRACVMRHGVFTLIGAPEEIERHNDFDAAYFGVTMAKEGPA